MVEEQAPDCERRRSAEGEPGRQFYIVVEGAVSVVKNGKKLPTFRGGSQFYGEFSAYLLRDAQRELARRMAKGEPTQAAVPFDPKNGVVADGKPYGDGAASGTLTGQPASVARGAVARIAWTGGEKGLDRPLDTAFIRVERRVKKRVPAPPSTLQNLRTFQLQRKQFL